MEGRQATGWVWPRAYRWGWGGQGRLGQGPELREELEAHGVWGDKPEESMMPPKGEFWKRKRAWERSEQKCPKRPYVIPGGVECVQEVWGVRRGSGHKQSKVPSSMLWSVWTLSATVLSFRASAGTLRLWSSGSQTWLHLRVTSAFKIFKNSKVKAAPHPDEMAMLGSGTQAWCLLKLPHVIPVGTGAGNLWFREKSHLTS